MRSIHVCLSTTFFLLFTCNLFAFEANKDIVGTVVEESTKEVISYATVALYNNRNDSLVTGTISDDKGKFSISNINEGSYYLKITFMGYWDKIIEPIVFKENESTLDLGSIKLRHNIEALKEVVVTAKTQAIKNTVDKQVISVRSNLVATGGNAIDALALSPSIQIDSDNNVKLRGSANFIVLVNGKPTSLSPNDVLKQTPANTISRIEVITNPSVKYNAEGGAGIINIILKKSVTAGLNSIANAGIGSRNKYSADVNVNLNKEHVSYSFGFDWRDHTKVANNNYYRTLYNEENTHFASMLQDRKVTDSNAGFRFGVDYNPNETNNFYYSLHTGYTKATGRILNSNSGFTVPASTEELKFNPYYFNVKPTFFTNNLGYITTTDKGNQITLNLYYSFINYDLDNSQSSYRTDENREIIDTTPFRLNISNNNHSHDVRFDGDYTSAISGNTKLESGISYHQYNRFLDITYSEFDYVKNDWENNQDYTGRYDFKEKIYAGYINLNSSFWNLNASFGLRVEFMDRVLKQKNTGDRYHFDQVNFFPGLSISKEINDFNSLKLSLTNRINRPDEYMMNPFPDFVDDYFVNVGNPYLIPEKVRNLELGFNYSKDKTSFSSNLYYRTTKDKIDQKLTIREDDKILTMFHNDVKDWAMGLESMTNFRVNDWWNVNVNANIFYYKISANLEGERAVGEQFSWSSQIVNTLHLSRTTSIQLMSNYASKTARSQGELSDYFFTNVALNKKFLDGSLTINIQVKDVLQSFNYELETSTSNMDLLADFNNESPIFLFNISYKFNNYKKKTRDVKTEFDM